MVDQVANQRTVSGLVDKYINSDYDIVKSVGLNIDSIVAVNTEPAKSNIKTVADNSTEMLQIATAIANGSFTPDDALSLTSTSSVENRVVTAELNKKETIVNVALKADKTYTDTQLDLKEDKTAITAKLLLKTDKTYTDTQLALKDNIVDVDNKLSVKEDTASVDAKLLLKGDKTYIDTQLALKENSSDSDSKFLLKADKTEVIAERDRAILVEDTKQNKNKLRIDIRGNATADDVSYVSEKAIRTALDNITAGGTSGGLPVTSVTREANKQLKVVLSDGNFTLLPLETTVDIALSATSTNPLENKIIKAELDLKASTSQLHPIETKASIEALAVSYTSLADKPVVDTFLSNTSLNAVQNKLIKDALDLKANTAQLHLPETKASIEALTVSYTSLTDKPVALPAITPTDKHLELKVNSAGTDWELKENLTLSNGVSLKHGGTYVMVGAPAFTTANTLPTAGSVDGVSIKVYFVGDTVTTPIAFNPQAGETVNGDAVGVDFAGYSTIEFFTYNGNWEYRMVTA